MAKKKSKAVVRPFAKKRQPNKVKETVRVKTFIVEKPVYIPATGVERERQRIIEEHAKKYDSKKSRYAKSDAEEDDASNPAAVSDQSDVDDTTLDDGVPTDDQELSEDDMSQDPSVDPELSDEELGELPAEGEVPQRRVRSRAMIFGVWWKRAIFWAFLFWAAILIFAFVLQFLKLIDAVELTRNWWVLFILLIAISLVWQKFLHKEKTA